jgi:hypothetical protein
MNSISIASGLFLKIYFSPSLYASIEFNGVLKSCATDEKYKVIIDFSIDVFSNYQIEV